MVENYRLNVSAADIFIRSYLLGNKPGLGPAPRMFHVEHSPALPSSCNPCSTWNNPSAATHLRLPTHPSLKIPEQHHIALATTHLAHLSFARHSSALDQRMPSTQWPRLFDRRQAIQGALAVTAASFLPGCGSTPTSTSGSTSGSPSNSNPQPVPAGSITSASLTVSPTTVGSIGPAFAGLSYEKASLTESPYLFAATNANLIALFKLIGPSLLRIGGNSVDRNVWTPNGPGQTPGQIAPSDVDSLAAFVKATGWQCLYGVNLGGSGPNPYTSGSILAATTPALAAGEIAYALKAFGSSLAGFEIGNECDLYGNSYFAGTAWNLSAFESLWTQFRSAILAQSPQAASLCTGPASASAESSWTVPFGRYATNTGISLLTQHYYRGNGQASSSTAANLVTPDPTLIGDLQTLQAGSRSIGVPYRISECNSYYNGGASGVSDAYASSLWVLDFLFDCALNGAAGTNFHGGGAGSGYTPIADSGGIVLEARPEFYGILLFTLAGQGSLYATSLSGAAGLNVTAYAVQSSSGGLNLLIVNKDSSQNLQLSISLPQNPGSATLLQMTQLSASASSPSLSATYGVTIQGATVDPTGQFTPGAAYILSPDAQLTCYVPLLSAVLIQIQ